MTPTPDAGNQVPDSGGTPEASTDAASDGSDEGSAPEASTPTVDASTPADAGSGSSTGCPPNSTCQAVTPVGPNCQP